MNKKTLYLTLFLVLVFALWSLRLALIPYIDLRIDSPLVESLTSIVIRFCIFVLPPVLYLKWIDQIRATAYLRLTTQPKRGAWVSGVILVLGVIWYFASAMTDENGQTGASWLTLVDYVLVAALFEEILWRGFVLQKLDELLTFHTANILTSILFVAMHCLMWWMTMRVELDYLIIRVLILFFLISLPLGYLLKQSGSLLPCITLHMVLNFIAEM